MSHKQQSSKFGRDHPKPTPKRRASIAEALIHGMPRRRSSVAAFLQRWLPQGGRVHADDPEAGPGRYRTEEEGPGQYRLEEEKE